MLEMLNSHGLLRIPMFNLDNPSSSNKGLQSTSSQITIPMTPIVVISLKHKDMS